MFDAQPTASERQRENLSSRLRREFGLALPDDEEARPPTDNTGMSTCRHNSMGHGAGCLTRHVYAAPMGPHRTTFAAPAPAPSNCHEDSWGQNIKTSEQMGHPVDNQWNNNMYSTAYGYKTGVKGLKWGRRGV